MCIVARSWTRPPKTSRPARSDSASRFCEFIDTLPHTPAAETVSRQLARAATGVVGNYRSACRARSHAEFTARMGIVADEADESELWIDVTNERAWGDEPQRILLLKESLELRAIFSAAYQTARPRSAAQRKIPSSHLSFVPLFLCSLLSAILQFCNPAIFRGPPRGTAAR